MKHWIWYLAGLLVTAGIFGVPFTASDVAKLQPVQVVQVSLQANGITVQTDTGDLGIGESLGEAFDDLKRTTPGYVFLETAQYLLVTHSAASLLQELSLYLRPGCSVYVLYGEADLTEVAQYLSAHTSNVTLRDCAADDCSLPLLVAEGGKISVAKS